MLLSKSAHLLPTQANHAVITKLLPQVALNKITRITN